jgi:hypothetical protein
MGIREQDKEKIVFTVSSEYYEFVLPSVFLSAQPVFRGSWAFLLWRVSFLFADDVIKLSHTPEENA